MSARPIPQFAPFLGTEEYAALGECFARNWITEGAKSAEFVEELRNLMGARHAVLAPNGTLSIYLALRALGIGPGDEVIVPDCTFFGTASAVEMAGATPVFCDVDPETLQAGAANIEPWITPRTRALLPVHLFGGTCDMDPILALAEANGLKVIEDAAQAIGVTYHGKHAGTLGDAGCFSFFADKTITTGEGGLVVTADEEMASRLKRLRNQGRLERGTFVHEEVGYNFRMTDLQAALGLAQLAKLEEIASRKQAIIDAYRTCLADIAQVRFLRVTPGSTQIPFRTVLLADRAHELMRHLEAEGVVTRSVFYPLHRQPAFARLAQNAHGAERMRDANFPNSNFAFENGICLPSYPALVPEDLEHICEQVHRFYA